MTKLMAGATPMSLEINPFCRTQPAFDPKMEDELIRRVVMNWHRKKSGHTRGSFLVPIEPDGFRITIVTPNDGDEFRGVFGPRPGAQGDTAVKHCSAPSSMFQPAKFVTVVVYSRESLEEDDSAVSSGADFEIVSILTSPQLRKMKIHI